MTHALPVIGSGPAPPETVPSWLAKGFRPFFLLASCFAALIVALWLLALAGTVRFDGLAGATAVLALVRCLPWGARHVMRHPLLWILHAGHAWIIVGLALRAAAELTSRVPPAAAIHALTVGAIGCTTLGMMARVSLGHSGRPLVAPFPVALAFGALTLAAILRVLGVLSISFYSIALYVSGTLWSLGFAAFAVVYAPILVRRRIDGRPG